MAAEEVDKPSSPPSYSEMILAAIEAVGEKKGMSRTEISKYVEAQSGELPSSHWAQLDHHLDQLRKSGQLVLVKNNYMKPDPNAPPKRGRGRPPKPKPDLPPGALTSPPRPRGRPPKPKDPSAPREPSSGRPRGRPPKKSRPAVASSAGSGRPRGRPPKQREEIPVVGFD